MSLANYIRQIKEWEQKYGVPNRAFRFDPTEIITSCVKCGKTRRKMSRHHIHSDFVFALLLPDVYAKRYLEFRKEETVKLCNICHLDVERFTEPVKRAMYADYTQAGLNEAWCELWRRKFKEAFDRWMAKGKKKKRRKRKRSRSA